VLQLGGADLGVMEVEPAAGFLAALVDVDVDELAAQLGGGQQVGIGAGDRLRGELDRAFAALELLDHRFEHHLFGGAVVEHPGVVGHPQRVAVGINAPVAFSVLLPEVFLAPAAEPSSAANWRMPALRRMLPARS